MRSSHLSDFIFTTPDRHFYHCYSIYNTLFRISFDFKVLNLLQVLRLGRLPSHFSIPGINIECCNLSLKNQLHVIS